MLTIHVWPKRLKEFLLTHPLYKSPPISTKATVCQQIIIGDKAIVVVESTDVAVSTF